ncbi:TA system VapC family ribonuclease toxin [Luteitalea sp.]|uniref:TA system VapC family ribonuclease toxin n=1 Tax=Luteitalea sp. TaxID=2004800 RepID=UPI0037C70DC5
MKIVDLNILLYAVNSAAPGHRLARAWWEDTLNDQDVVVGLPWVVVLGFLRLATNGRVFPKPMSPAVALARVDAWLGRDTVRVVREKDDHWATLRALLAASGTAGNLTTDAHLAALALSHDAVLVSSDADFTRFAGLRLENPLRG